MNGILLIDKPILYTSHDIVDCVRRKLKIRRVGHAGTLDPMATGLLVVMVGTTTSLFEALSSQDKTYEGMMTLGMEARTQDAEGEIVRTADTDGVREEDVRNVFGQFRGRLEQQIPHYSAAKIHGKKGYELARKRIDFKPPVKTIDVKELRLQAFLNPDIYFYACVSKGTYLRALAADIGTALRVGAVLTALRRVCSGCYHVRESLTLVDLERLSQEELARHGAHQLLQFEKRGALKPA